ncbi:hypothetical protein F3Y22_tig00110925pilonHSYRG00076 [Hibiscus syriacus]|uniref:Uncharacterized protein n=1 Tax=Hibiscus syriacus TaxID=106335 RepID=A0A6A2ZEP9_HIBSY|nr:hypothetical protein F3Y22_tig00110925pilonHSYRG00076 [Hibiscus syriacus]
MGTISKSFLLLALLSALVILIASEVAARDLAETTTEKKNGMGRTGTEIMEVMEDTVDVEDTEGAVGMEDTEDAKGMEDTEDVVVMEDAVPMAVVVLIIMEEAAGGAALIPVRLLTLKLTPIHTTKCSLPPLHVS